MCCKPSGPKTLPVFGAPAANGLESLNNSRRRAQVEAEEVPDVSEKMDVAAVPFFTLHRVRAAFSRSVRCGCGSVPGVHGSA